MFKLNFIFLVMPIILLAQHKITGTLQTSPGDPIIGAKIILSGSSLSTESSADGIFSFADVATGNYTLLISSNDYDASIKEIALIEDTNLGIILLQESQESIVLDDLELDSDEGSSSYSSAYLSSSQDIFQKTSAYQWGGFFFSPRGYSADKHLVLFNGIVMNKAQDNEPLWRDWGGLNDITRYPKERTFGLRPSPGTLGSLASTTSYSTRASDFQKGGRLTLSLTDYSYTQRIAGTYATGMQDNGLALVFSGARRWSNEGIIDATFYDSWSYFLAIEKKLSPSQSLNFTTFGAPYRRSSNSPNTQEVYDLANIHYNAYWGWQEGEQRNERIKSTFEPMFMLSHYWDINKNSKLETSISYQTGRNGYTRLERGDQQYNANGAGDDYVDSPSPIYYRYLPSYESYDKYNTINWDNSDPYAGPVIDRQINWFFLYQTNYWNGVAGKGAAYYQVEDVNDDDIVNANSHFQSRIGTHGTFDGALSYRYTQSHNYRKLIDLLGGLPISNIDFYTDIDFDLSNNSKIGEGDVFNYDYNLFQHRANAYGLMNFSYATLDFYVGADLTYNHFWRSGNYLNGYTERPENTAGYTSYGDSQKETFIDYGLKAGLLYKLNGKNFLFVNGLYQTVAPTLEEAYPNARYMNVTAAETAQGLEPAIYQAAEARYVHRGKKLNAKIIGYYTQVKNDLDVITYYSDGFGAFTYASLYDLDTEYLGTEIGLEYRLSPSLKASAVASIGQFIYANNPGMQLISDGFIYDQSDYDYLNEVYLTNYKLDGSPQRAYNLGLEYQGKSHWWMGIFWNLLSHNYVGLSPLSHTTLFTETAPQGSEDMVRELLKQERFSTEYFINISLGKSWRIKEYSLVSSLNINNVLNNQTIKTGGFEQGYKDTYTRALNEYNSDNPRWGNRYWYQQGLTFFLNMIYKF